MEMGERRGERRRGGERESKEGEARGEKESGGEEERE